LVKLEFVRASCLQSRHSTTWTIPLVHFVLVVFWRWGLVNYFPRWPQTSVLLISAFQAARIVGVSHQFLAVVFILFFFFLSFICILEINTLLDEQLSKISPHFVGCLLTLVIISFAVQKSLNLMQSHLSILAFIFWVIGVIFRKSFFMPVSSSVLL
jgi:hypothetical protein